MNINNILPAFKPVWGFTLLYLGLVVFISLSTLLFKTFANPSFFKNIVRGFFK